MQRRDLFVGGRRDPFNLSGVQLVRQFMKLNSFICLTYHLSDNLKIQHKFSPVTYTNQEFWFHLCYIHSLVMHEKLIGRLCCFYIDGIQKYTIVFKLKIFNLHMFSRTLDIKCSFIYSNFALYTYFASLNLSTLCYYITKNKGTFNSL